MESHNIARSLKGHAAQSGVDKWVMIQENTFRNWVNEQLRTAGIEVNNLENDFDNGVRLCALMESLQGKRIRVIKNPRNHHQQLANVAEALTAISNDNIRLVNIGPEDIVNGNLKLILGLIWHLILRYQIGKSKFPTKKLMLAWLQAVIPDCSIRNFTSDWNDGVALSALIEFCRPGLFSDWRHLSRSAGLDNCRNAMNLAKQHFDIPLVVRPEDLSSSDLDELSGMTYLSYFMKLDSPGYHATLKLVQRLLRSGTVNNFTSDWSDGRMLCNLVTSVGGHVSGWPALTDNGVENMQLGLHGAKGLGIEPILSAKEMADPEVDHIGIMAYAAYFSSFKPVRSAAEKVVISSLPQNVSVGQEASFRISLEDDEVSSGDIRAEVQGPDSNHTVSFNWTGRSGQGYFTPTETGLHRLTIYCENQTINGCPASFKVLADRSKVTFTSVDSCSLGNLTELQVNCSSAGAGEVRVEARTPSGRTMNLSPVPRHGGNYVSNFNPTEVGEWEISVIYDDEHISGSPYIVSVYDPASVKVYGLEGGTVGQGLSFNADTSRAGRGDVRVQVEYDGSYVSSNIYQETAGLYKIDFTPRGSGVYTSRVYFNDVEVRGSPFTVDIFDSSNVTVSGDGLSLVAVNRMASFNVQGAGNSKVDVEISSMGGSWVPSNVKELPDGSHTVQFIPTAVGDHKVNVVVAGQQVKGCPYTLRVYDASKVMISNMPSTCMVATPVVFDIDASKAGSGNIEIMVNDGEIACSVQNHGNYRFTASFLPANNQEHVVEMKFNSDQVRGSPWKIAMLDPNKMSVMGPGLGNENGYIPLLKSLLVTCSMAGMDPNILSITIIAPNGSAVPFRQEQGTGECRIEYTATVVGDHVITIKYSDQEVPGSPFNVKAYNTSAIEVSKLPDGVVGLPIEFGIDVRKAGEGQLEIMVNNGNLPNTVENDITGVYKMSFVPETAGQQTVDIIFNGESHPDSPFICNAVDLSSVSVSSLELQIPADWKSSFYLTSQKEDISPSVDIISPSGHDIAVTYKQDKDGRQRIEYTPTEVGVHTISVTYLGAHIDGSPYQIKTYDPKLVRLSKMPLGILNIPFKFRVLGEDAGDGQMEVTVETEGERIPSELTTIRDGTFEVTFMGDGERTHTLDILFNGQHIPGSPVSINFADVDKIKIEKPASLLVPCDRQLGLNMASAPTAIDDLVIHIDGPVYNSVPFHLRNIGDRKYRIDWTPVKPGTYDVDVRYGDVIPVWGSPMKIRAFDSRQVQMVDTGYGAMAGERYMVKFDVQDAGEGDLGVVILCQGQTVQSAIRKGTDDLIWVSFEPEEERLYEIFVSFNKEPIPAPNGDRVHAELFSEGSGKYRVEWTPRVAGRHTVEIQLGGRVIEGSPFYVDVFDLSLIRIDNFRHGTVGEDAGFSVDFSSAGTLDHEIQIVGPSGHDVVLDGRELGFMWKDYMYEPEEAGKYKIYVKYGGFQVPGCPFTQDISDGGLPTASGAGLFFAEEDKPANFNVDVGRRKGDLGVSVSGPNSIAKCSVDPQADGSYTVTYIPVETGIFDISLTWNGTDVPGSPYHPKVVDARKVKIIGGWHRFMDGSERVTLHVGERKQLPFDVTEAGPGMLKAEVKGPSHKIDADIDTHTVGKVVVEFTPEEEGNHYINLYWSDIPLVNSPFLGYAIQQQADPSKLILTGRGLKEAIVREEAEFTIDGSQAGPGTPEVVLSGVRAEVNVKTISIGNGKFRCSYMPIVPGAYLLHITWNGRQLRGSPYKVNVIGAFYPNKVVVSGEGLRGGLLGRELDIRIDTRKAGPGELTAYCMGPNAVAFCELEDNRDGAFRLGVKAKEPGRHVLQIKYGGEHVQGSPFVFKVMQQPDASKVRVTGPGVEYGLLATFVSRFIVETKGAGAGQLTVRIRGPKGAFQVEMYRDSQRDRTILCRFDPVETGLYIISVKWSGVDVPGSPFQVHIMDTQEELEQVLGDMSFSMHSRIGSQGSQHTTPRIGYGQWLDRQ